MTEIWREIPSFPGYLASSKGRIRGPRGWILTPYRRKDGYLQLSIHRNDQKFSRRVHVLVCEAFHGVAPSSDHQVAHGNGKRCDNRKNNLRWATYRENRDDMKLHGTYQTGERHPRAGLTVRQVEEIRAAAKEALLIPTHHSTLRIRGHRGFRQKLAQKYGVSLHVIKDILAGRSWNT